MKSLFVHGTYYSNERFKNRKTLGLHIHTFNLYNIL